MGKHFKDLVAWQKSMDLLDQVYAAIERFPPRERFALADQLRRAAISVPSNIAEGQARYSPREFRKFLRDARGSLAEIETQVLIGQRRAYLDGKTTKALCASIDEVGRIVNGLINSLPIPEAEHTRY